MLKKSSRSSFIRCCRYIAVILCGTVLLMTVPACADNTRDPEEKISPSAAVTSSPPPAPTPTPEPSPTSSEPVVSFPPLETSETGACICPQVVADKTSAKTQEPVNFKIVTSEDVKSVQTVIDGEPGRVYTEYEKDADMRVWQTEIHFTVGGDREVQYKCTMASGDTVLIPDPPVTIDVTFHYKAASTSGEITKGKTVTFTLRTPAAIDTIYALVDDVNQNIAFTESDSNEDGVKTWKVNITFFQLGEREIQFNACIGSEVQKTFPDPGIPITVAS